VEVEGFTVIETCLIDTTLGVVTSESGVNQSTARVDSNASAVSTHDVINTRVNIGATENHLSHLLTVSECDTDWNCQLLSDLDRYTDFVDPEVWVRRNDRARTEVDTLSREVRSESPFFAFQSLC
tara:strand:- start:244 stop:618 length:375 start_codon:yes stop_codon:yes gene_type:complete